MTARAAGPPPGDTPMMRQWRELKRQFPDAILFFRLGDFYEMFHEDAEVGARELEITLTGRDAGPEGRVPMCGVPHHAVESYLARLVARGHRVAICDQTEDPAQARGLVDRRVTRLVTPGSRMESSLLDERRNTYAAALAPAPARGAGRGGLGVAFADVSTGELACAWLPADEAGDIWDDLARRGVAEVIVPDPWPGGVPADLETRARGLGIALAPRPAAEFTAERAGERLRRHFGVSTLAGFGVPDGSPEASAAGALLAYLEHTLQGPAAQVTALERWERDGHLRLDEATRRNLEVSERLDGGERGSLLWAVDGTVTSMGARLLRRWFLAPLTDRGRLSARLAAVSGFVADGLARAAARKSLGAVHDVERLVARAAAGRAGPRDLLALRRSLEAVPDLVAAAGTACAGALADVLPDLAPPEDLTRLLAAALAEDPPVHASEGGVIRDGWSAELDSLRQLKQESRTLLARLEEGERERTGIRSLKVGFNRVFGYYIEVTHANRAAVPPEYIRKQTLANAERYVTEELKALEERLLHAEERALALEERLFRDVCGAVVAELPRLQRLARALALCDVVAGLAHVAAERGYVRPEMVDEPVLHVEEGRHPVVEALLGPGRYVPADILMDEGDARFLLLTGPNMAGKSTYARSVALLTFLAQIGSFVPARSARIGIADAIYARIGARDDLSAGESTFMREMIETSRILRGATRRSLVVVDEVGRGTSTYDGLAIAWAVAEDLAARVQARTVFTTHYHELTALEGRLRGVKNLTMAVAEDPETGEIAFLHSVRPGAADRSYGIHVAALAGVPGPVRARAAEVLAELERQAADGRAQAGPAFPEAAAAREALAHGGTAGGEERQLSLLAPAGHPREAHPLERLLAALDLDGLPPRDALALLYEWKRRFGKRGG